MDRMAADPTRKDHLVLVDGLDRQIGTATKEEVHRAGLLHRAFSVLFVREGAGEPELLLTRRAEDKYHSGGLWANSCCSHPRVGEGLLDAARRRVREELGCDACGLHEIGAFVYRAEFEDGICEYEYDHVLLGTCAGPLAPNPGEVGAVRWVAAGEVAEELAGAPELFTPWAYTVLSLALRELVP